MNPFVENVVYGYETKTIGVVSPNTLHNLDMASFATIHTFNCRHIIGWEIGQILNGIQFQNYQVNTLAEVKILQLNEYDPYFIWLTDDSANKNNNNNNASDQWLRPAFLTEW